MENIDKNDAMFPSDIDDSQYFEERTLPIASVPELSVESIRVKKLGRGRKREIFQKDTFDIIPPAVNYVPGDEFYDNSESYDDFDGYTYADDDIEAEYDYTEDNLVEHNFAHTGYEYAPQHYYESDIEENATLVKIPMTDSHIINPGISSSAHIASDITAIDAQAEIHNEILTASVSINHIGLKSVAKVSSAVGGAMGIIWVLFLGILYFLLDILGVWKKFNSSFSGGSVSVSGSLLSTWIVLLFTVISGVVLFLAIVCGSLFIGVLYNVCAETFGGVRMELKDAPWDEKLDLLASKK